MTRIKTYLLKTTALLLCCGFMYVQGKSFVCSVNHLIDLSGIAHAHPFGHDHHHAHDDAPADHHHDAGAHEESEDSCCNDFTQAFLGEFSKANSAVHFFSCKLLEAECIIPWSFSVTGVHEQMATGISPCYSLPPPKIPDIRVFIRSFQV